MRRSTPASGCLRLALVLAVFLSLTAATSLAASDATAVTLATQSTTGFVLGTPTTLNASVSDSTSSMTPVVGGTVSFFDNGVLIGTAPVAGVLAPTAANFVTSVLTVGSHSFTAQYNGAAGFQASAVSSAVVQVINQRDSSTAIPALGSVQVRSASPVTATVTDVDHSTHLPVPGAGSSSAISATLKKARTGATATTLLDGTVLVAGGSSDGTAAKVLASAEIFDPKAGTFTTLSSNLTTARFHHSATLLSDGTVLIAGGEDGSSAALSSTEIYNPNTQAFSAGAAMTTARIGDAATLLPDGSVLFAGGSSDGTGAHALASAEIYSAGAFTAAANSMGTARYEPSATLLHDGTVLFAGGEDGSGALTTTEVFTPTASPAATGTFAAGSALNIARFGHSATLLPDGTVLIAGGTGTNALSSFEIYDPLAKSFVAVSGQNLSTARTEHVATLLNTGFVLVVGGSNGSNPALSTAEEYLPAYDPQGGVSLASDNGGGATPDTIAGCTLTITGTGTASCFGSVTPAHVYSGTHNITATYLADWAAGTQYALNAEILPSSANNNASQFVFAATAAGTSGSSAPGFDGQAPNEGNTLGDGTVTWTNEGVSRHNTSTSETEALTATQAPVTISGIVVTGKTYDSTTTVNPASINVSGALVNGALNGDTLGVTATGSLAGVYTPNGNAGNNKTVNISGLQLSGTNAADYQLPNPQATATATISQATLDITANNRSKTYGTNVIFAGTEFSITFGQLFGTDNIAGVTLTSPGAIGTASVAGSPYAISITLGSAVGPGVSNYNISYLPGILQVQPALLTITANNDTKNYGATKTYGSGSTAFTSTGLQNGETVGSVTLTSSGGAANAAAGSYTIAPSAATGGTFSPANYNIAYANGILTVSTATLTITANSTSKTYGSTVTFAGNEFTTSGLLNGDTVTSVTLTSAGAPAFATVAGSPYTIVPSSPVFGAGSASNYTISLVNGSFAVNPAPLSITANNRSKIYGQTVTFAGTEFTSSGLLNGDTISSVSLTSAGAAAAATVAGAPYSIVPSSPLGSGLSNYSPTFVNGTLSVTPAALSVIANNKSRSYGQSNPTFDGTLTGVTAGDNITATFSTAAITTSPIGSYAIAATLNDPTSRLGNYTVTNTPGTLTITQAALVITPNDKSRTYGDPNPALDGNVTGVTAGDNITASFSTTATQTSVIGGYQITSTINDPGNKLSNYSLTQNTGTLTINKAQITVAANDQTRVYGGTNPTLDGSLTGVTAGDNITSSFSTAATAASVVGNYAIAATLSDPGNRLGNYNVADTPGTLTVTAAPLTITAKNVSKTFGQTVTFAGTEFTTSGLVNNGNGDTVSSVTITSGGSASLAAVGAYGIAPTSPSGSGLGNYTITLVPGALTVGPATTNSVVVSPQSTKNSATFTFIATVAPQFAGVPGGTVTFMDNGTALASKIPLDANGQASFNTTVNELAAGQTHTITAVYNKDDPNFAAATTQVGASITVGAALTTTPGAPIPAQTLQLANPSGSSVTYSGLSCGVLDAFGNTVKNTICTATPVGSFTLPATATLTIATSNGNSTTAFSAAPQDVQRVHALESLWLAMPAMVLLPLAIPAETRRRLREKKALFVIGLLLVLCVVLVSVGCGGGNGFSNPNNQQPGTVGTAATPNGSYVVQITATNQQGQSVAVGSIPLTVAAN